jgi:hypothetical protein
LFEKSEGDGRLCGEGRVPVGIAKADTAADFFFCHLRQSVTAARSPEQSELDEKLIIYKILGVAGARRFVCRQRDRLFMNGGQSSTQIMQDI